MISFLLLHWHRKTPFLIFHLFSKVLSSSSTNLQVICWSNLLINSSASLVSLSAFDYSPLSSFTSAHLSQTASSTFSVRWERKEGSLASIHSLQRSWVADKTKNALEWSEKEEENENASLKFKLNSLAFLLINFLKYFSFSPNLNTCFAQQFTFFTRDVSHKAICCCLPKAVTVCVKSFFSYAKHTKIYQ